jgi:anthranilate/para-aminobenzoate synthase component II
MATLIKTNGDKSPIMQEHLGLNYLQQYVGGYIEHVALRDGTHLWVNEEGLIKGLPINLLASAMYGSVICGDVVLLSNEEFHADEDEEDDET